MRSTGDSYHIEINGIAEGPMTVRDLVWKIGMAGNDDVILFRLEGSADWQPLEGSRERLQELAAAQLGNTAAPASAPKLRLRKRGSSPTPESETPPPFHSEPPPLPPQSGNFNPAISPDSDELASADVPPPPPGAPPTFITPPPLTVSGGIHLSSHNGTIPTSVPPSQSLPSPKIAPLLLASFVITLAIAGYLFFFMKQPVSFTATLPRTTSTAAAADEIRYAVISTQVARRWKASSLEKLRALADKAKTETAASTERTGSLITKGDELTSKYAAECRALFTVGTNANYLSLRQDLQSKADIRSLRQLESAADIAEAYLSSSTRADLAARRYRPVALAARIEGFPNLIASFEREIRATEAALADEQEKLRPVVEDSGRFLGGLMTDLPEDTETVASGKADEAGRFEPSLPPGEHHVIARKENASGSTLASWAVAFSVKPFAENKVVLSEHNLGNKAPESLWQRADTLTAENDITAIRERARRISELREAIQTLRAEIGLRHHDLRRLLAD